MTTKPPDPRRKFIDLLEAECVAAGNENASYFARHFVLKLDAAGLLITEAPRRVEDPVADPRTDPAMRGDQAARGDTTSGAAAARAVLAAAAAARANRSKP
ncbi:MAG TPA: hypothetical protein VGS97_20125 [Actinocrinis sp.]|uniref:hypothetical protein n=1 Tax=Actinocrinis sp. TaxID=1920516 RepID=UPI002DDD1C28|nr:hypothetical protein [Actinocrinis sp.]HEV2346417.1 hypothetical protein [Actinocrinis sp.]